MNKDTTITFRTTETIKALSEILSKKKGQSKSEFIGLNVIDKAMNFERTRHIDTLADFLDVALPYITQGMDKDEADKLVNKLTTLQKNYVQQRLGSHMKVQSHLTDIAIRSYIQDYGEEFEGLDGFIIQQCVVSIYDQLLEYGLITKEEWQEKTLQYDLYMDEEGLQLLHQE